VDRRKNGESRWLAVVEDSLCDSLGVTSML
jgi:hypothetical protein